MRKMMARTIRRGLWVLIGSLSLVAVAVVVHPRGENSLRRAKVPDGGLCPDIASDAGRLHVVYGRKDAVYYANSTDGARTFSAPTLVAGSHYSAVVGHERGPKIALGQDGSIHVTWMGANNTTVFYSRSTDGGQHFSQPRNLAPRTNGVDGPSIAADDAGEVYVVWIQAGEGPESPVSKTLMFAYSRDNGNTFAPAKPLPSTYPGGACACCAVKAVLSPEHTLLVGFRGAYRNIRDIYLLRETAASDRFQATPVSNDHWVFEGCPMAGPSVQATARPGQVLVAWMSDGRVYHATSTDGGQSFSSRSAPAERQNAAASFPLILSNARGEQLFAWVEGRTIRWERISPDGRILEAGENGGLPSSSKPTALADRDGSFALIY
jgi:hypothetical protein